MLNQNVMLCVKGISKNVHTVSVEKCSENGAVSIADKLMGCELAKNITSEKQSTLHAGIFPPSLMTNVSVIKNRCS